MKERKKLGIAHGMLRLQVHRILLPLTASTIDIVDTFLYAHIKYNIVLKKIRTKLLNKLYEELAEKGYASCNQ